MNEDMLEAIAETRTGKKVFLRTFGCQMNEYDSELVRAILAKAGYRFTDNEAEADIILLNTCSVRENAHRKVYGHIHEIHHRQKGKKGVLVGLLGCMATGLREELLERNDLKLDFIVGPDSYKRLPEMIKQCTGAQERRNTRDKRHGTRNKGQETRDAGRTTQAEQRTLYDVTLSELETYSDIFPARRGGINPSTALRTGPGPCAWVAIMRGCNNFCSFCIVPLARGRERSRAPQNVLEEIERLIREEDVKQVTLLGQNVNSYHSDGKDFSDLLNMITPVAGLLRVRFTSPHPKDFPKKLIETIARNPKICKHIHLPLQSGNDRVLGLMNRGYTGDDYRSLVKKIRAACPGIALTTDVIVGFPTEKDREFNDTLQLMREVEFDAAFMFKYSPRKGTAAQKKLPDDVPSEKKTERIVALNELQKEMSLKKNQAHIGETLEVLIEQAGTSRSQNDFEGRTDGNKLVILPPGSYKVGDLVQVKISQATAHVLKGKPPAA